MKKGLTILLVLCMLLSLAACGSSTESVVSASAPDVSEASAATEQTAPAASEPPAEPESIVTPDPALQSDPGDGGIGNGYVDDWYLFGDLSMNSIVIFDDSTWYLFDGFEETVYCEGYSAMDDVGDLLLYESSGVEIGFATLIDDELYLYLYLDYEWLLEDYLPGDLVFCRAGASVLPESQPLDDYSPYDEEPYNYPAYNEIGNGYVDDWALFGDRSMERITINDDGTWEIADYEDYIYCEGFAEMDEVGDLLLYEFGGEDVGYVSLAGDELFLTLFMDYRWLMEEYMPGDLVFARWEASEDYESQSFYSPEDYQGYWTYEEGYVLEIFDDEWFLYEADGTLIDSGFVDFGDEGASLQFYDGSDGGGFLYFEEDGTAYESGMELTWSYNFPE